MFDIDGSEKSGSGTILRLSVAFAAMSGQPLHIYNIRQNRPQPGLKPQHLEAVLTAAKLCNAKTQGATLNSRQLWFTPGKVKGGNYDAEIGTAGSIPMLILTVLPICALSKENVRLHISKGGTDTSNAPTINYLRFVLIPILREMGLDASITISKYGYYPKGMGEVTLTVNPCHGLKPFRLENFGNLLSIKGVSVCTFLAERKVGERQAHAAKKYISEKGYDADIQVVNDRSNSLQKGSSIVLWASTDTGTVLGADAIGKLGKLSETVGLEAAERLNSEISAKPTVDRNLSDMLVPYVALANESSIFLAKDCSEHLETNIWLAEKMLGSKFRVEKINGLFKIQKMS